MATLFSLTLSDGLTCKALPDNWVSIDGRVIQYSALVEETKREIRKAQSKAMRTALYAGDKAKVEALFKWGK